MNGPLIASLSPLMLILAWQQVVILAITLLVERWARPHAALRHAVLLCGLIANIFLPGFVLIETHLARRAAVTSNIARSPQQLKFAFTDSVGNPKFNSSPVELPGEAESTTRLFRTWTTWYQSRVVALVLVAWAIGSIFLLIRFVYSIRTLQNLRSSAAPASGVALDSARQLVQRHISGSLPPVLVSDLVRTPLMAGLFRPYVVIPSFALHSYTRCELAAILLHEFAHVRRRDVLVLLLQRLATVLFWPIPLWHRLNQLLNEAREDLCDNYVIAVTDAVMYGRTLLKCGIHAEGQRPHFAICLLAKRRNLEQRICRLLDETRPPATRLRPSALLLIASFFVALVTIVGAVQLHAQANGPTEYVFTVLDKGMEALNGEQSLKKLHAVSWNFATKSYGRDGIALVTGRSYRQGGDRFRCESHFECENVTADTIEVINGTDGWMKARNGHVTAISAEEDLTHTKINRLYMQWLTTLLPLKGPSYKISPVGERNIGDRHAIGMLVLRDGYSDVVLYFDKGTGLLLKSEMPVKITRGSEQELGRIVTQETYYTNYRETDGTRYASKITTYLNGKVRSSTEVSEFKTHGKLDDALFAKP